MEECADYQRDVLRSGYVFVTGGHPGGAGLEALAILSSRDHWVGLMMRLAGRIGSGFSGVSPGDGIRCLP